MYTPRSSCTAALHRCPRMLMVVWVATALHRYYSLVKSLEEQVKIVPGSYVPFTPVIQRALRNDPPSQWKSEDACDTSFTLGSMRAALRAAGAVCTAVDNVMSGDARHAFCVVRPPGHHAGVEGLMADAEKDSSCGFCIFNSVAIGALHAIETKGAVRDPCCGCLAVWLCLCLLGCVCVCVGVGGAAGA